MEDHTIRSANLDWLHQATNGEERMLLADVRRDEARTFPHRLQDGDFTAIAQVLCDMVAEMRASIHADFGDVPVSFDRLAEMRFVGQFHTVRIPVVVNDVAGLRRAFLDAYRAQYGHAMEAAPAEIVALHCAAKALTPKPDIAALAVRPKTGACAPRQICPVYFPEVDAALQTRVYSRSELSAGFSAAGPAVIEEYGSTTVVGPSDQFQIGELGEIRITVGHRPRGNLA